MSSQPHFPRPGVVNAINEIKRTSSTHQPLPADDAPIIVKFLPSNP
jgi:hypothetical protein